MKKYLTMVLAIAISGVFVGCHEDELSGSLIEQKKIAFEDAFIQAFGQPDPNHNWGFRMPDEKSLTRSENANANEWADPNKAYGGLKVPPPLTPEQIAVVKAYFQAVPNLGYEDPQWSNYFIQQVYKGNPTTAGTNSPEQYLAADGTNYILASDHMDHLLAIDPDKNLVDHINNFNHGDCSENGSVLDNGGNANGGPFHSDKIMYMMNSTTKSFAYHNSDGSLYHTEYTGLVGWETIHNWAKTNYKDNDGKDYDGCLKDDWNRSYMGFDFEQIVGEDVYAATRVYGNYSAENNYQGELISLTYESYHYFSFKGKQYHYLITNRNQYAADLKETSFIGKYGNKVSKGGIADFDNVPSDDVISELLEKGYLPVIGTADKTWVKVGGTADGYFSDWIVTLTEAKTTSGKPTAPQVKQVSETPGEYYVIVEEVIESGRVMCEDLAGASNDLDDLDYNDIVYDAVIVDEYKMPCDEAGHTIGNKEEDGYDHRYFATVRLMAAGGTIPIELVIPEENGKQNFDVHYELGAGDNVMINTLYDNERASVNGAQVAKKDPKTLINQKDKTDRFYGVKFISDIKLNVLYQNVSTELVNKYGAATYKFLVPLGTKWAKERIRFNKGYPNFEQWVYDKDYNLDWYNDNVPDNLYDDLEGLSVDDITYSDPIDIEGSKSYSKTSVAATSTMAYPSASEKTIYNFAAENADPGFLCPEVGSEDEEYLNVTLSDADKASIAVDQVIRIYGVNIDGWNVTTNIPGTESFESFSANGNYIEIPVTSSNINQIKSNIEIRGKHFTVTYVTIVG